jgi:hypothetical protein
VADPFDESFDYLGLLGVEAEQARSMGVAALQELLKRKRKEWTAQAINPLYQQRARADMGRAKELESLLKDPAAAEAWLRYAEVRQTQSRAAQQVELLPLLRLAAGDSGRITSSQRELLVKAAADRGIPAGVLNDALRQAGLKIVADPPKAELPTVPYETPAMDTALYRQIHGHLKVLDKETLYDAVELNRAAPPARIVAVAQTLAARWSKVLPKTAEVSAWEKSLQSCQTYLKTDELKARYDRAVHNARLDAFLEEAELRLARGATTRDDWTELVTAGVECYGLSGETARRALAHKALSRGLSMSPPVQVTVKTEGQVRCPRCASWQPATREGCPKCGAPLRRKCRHPRCETLLPADAKVCPSCGLSVSRGDVYRALWDLCAASLEAGLVKQSLDTLAALERIAPHAEFAVMRERAVRQRELFARVRAAAADRRWSAVLVDLPELSRLAPRAVVSGVPSLEDTTRFVAQARERLQRLMALPTPRERSAGLADLATQWPDDPGLLRAIRSTLALFDESGFNGDGSKAEGGDPRDVDDALLLARAWAAAAPDDPAAGKELDRREEARRALLERLREVDAARKQWERAVHDRRWYAAERAVATLDGLAPELVDARSRAEIAHRIAAAEAELRIVREALAMPGPRDPVLDRLRALLADCRDCREAVALLQSVPPDPPPAPMAVTIETHARGRTIRWRFADGLRAPDAIRVLRVAESPDRPGTFVEDTTALAGHASRHEDSTPFPSGTVLRYGVVAVRRSRTELAGVVLHESEPVSEIAWGESLLVWREVHSPRWTAGVSPCLAWQAPSGATGAEVLVRDTRDDIARPIARLPAETSRWTVPAEWSRPGLLWTIRCLFDGPAGEFATPGVTVSSGGAETMSEPPLPPSNGAVPEAIAAVPPDQTVDDADDVRALLDQAEPAAPSSNPLARFGLWPPRAEGD